MPAREVKVSKPRRFMGTALVKCSWFWMSREGWSQQKVIFVTPKGRTCSKELSSMDRQWM